MLQLPYPRQNTHSSVQSETVDSATLFIKFKSPHGRGGSCASNCQGRLASQSFFSTFTNTVQVDSHKHFSPKVTYCTPNAPHKAMPLDTVSWTFGVQSTDKKLLWVPAAPQHPQSQRYSILPSLEIKGRTILFCLSH